jgi:DNA-binding XRE family transcriptional regulator
VKVNKRKKLEKAGWKVGTVDDFLGLSPEESAYIDIKLALSRSLKEKRIKKRLSQVAFAEKIDSSQSRVAKMEAGDPSVSIDLLMKSLLALGASKKEVAKVISSNSA